jgi:two-component sensor histidine kinase
MRGERQQMLLIADLNHRVKNSLASVHQPIVAQTMRATPSIAHARSAITSRIIALSRVHDVLTHDRWTGADLRSRRRFSPLNNRRGGGWKNQVQE